MAEQNNQDDIAAWINNDKKVSGQETVASYTPPEPTPSSEQPGKLNLRLAKLGGLMLAAVYFPILYVLTGLNSLRDLAVYLVLVVVTGGICSLPVFRPKFEKSIRYFTALMATAITLAVALILYKAFF